MTNNRNPTYATPDYIRLHNEGKTNREIADYFGTTVGAAENWSKKARKKGLVGPRRTHKVWTPDRVKEAKALFDARVSVEEMAHRMGVTFSAMRACIAHRKWTRSERSTVDIPAETLRQLVAEGLNDVEIGKRLGYGSSTIQKQRVKAGIVAAFRGNAHSFTPAMDDQLAKLLKAGFSAPAIGKQMKVSEGFIRKRAKALGIWTVRFGPSPAHLTTPAVQKNAEATKREKRGLPPRIIPTVRIVEEAPEVIPDHARPWLTRKFGECAYPYGERGNVHSCCKPVFNGTSLCEGHASLCFDYRKAA